jgi:hypothetical protein
MKRVPLGDPDDLAASALATRVSAISRDKEAASATVRCSGDLRAYLADAESGQRRSDAMDADR